MMLTAIGSMKTITGKFNNAICYANIIEDSASEQIKALCDQECFADSKIRIMPDVHAGKGCTIGTTMTISDKIVPGIVGVDIGCGMHTTQIAEKDVDFEKLDSLIRNEIPSGRNIREVPHQGAVDFNFKELRCATHVNIDRAMKSIGSLGGGNHFIEIDASDDGTLFLIVHSGSRHIGNEVANHYQDKAYKMLCGRSKEQVAELIKELKSNGREKEIEQSIKALNAKSAHGTDIPKDLTYLTGEAFDDYIHDMKIIQDFASCNRLAMTETIMSGMEFTAMDSFSTIHNYIDTDRMILRKGAVSASLNERLLIPINMRDGSLICVGKGNGDWNYSAPHGAGRLMSRKAASQKLSMDEYASGMSGIFTTCVSASTLDESPMAYKSAGEITGLIEPTAQIAMVIKPLYNFKASE